jgi:hypothetical protein
MTVRRTIVVLTALCAVVTCAPAPAAAARKKPLPNCAAKKSETVLATKDARVYALRDDPSADASIYACNYRKNRRVLLGFETECANSEHVKGVRLAGRYVGYLTETCGIDTDESSDAVQAVDLLSGKTLWQATAPSIADFEMTRTGSLVWFGSGSTPSTTEVRKLEPGSPAGGTIVDTGTDVVPGSLALGGDGFYYRKGTTPLFAPLQ